MNHGNIQKIKQYLDDLQYLKNIIGSEPDNQAAKDAYNSGATVLRRAIIDNVTVADLMEIAEYIVAGTEKAQKQG